MPIDDHDTCRAHAARLRERIGQLEKELGDANFEITVLRDQRDRHHRYIAELHDTKLSIRQVFDGNHLRKIHIITQTPHGLDIHLEPEWSAKEFTL